MRPRRRWISGRGEWICTFTTDSRLGEDLIGEQGFVLGIRFDHRNVFAVEVNALKHLFEKFLPL